MVKKNRIISEAVKNYSHFTRRVILKDIDDCNTLTEGNKLRSATHRIGGSNETNETDEFCYALSKSCKFVSSFVK